MLNTEFVLFRYTLVTFPGQLLLILPIMQMSTTEPIMWLISPLGPTLGGPLGPLLLFLRKIFFTQVLVFCLLPCLCSFAMTWMGFGQSELETDIIIAIVFTVILTFIIIIVVHEPVLQFLSELRARIPLNDDNMRCALYVLVGLCPSLIRLAQNGMAMEGFMDVISCGLMLAFGVVFHKLVSYYPYPTFVILFFTILFRKLSLFSEENEMNKIQHI